MDRIGYWTVDVNLHLKRFDRLDKHLKLDSVNMAALLSWLTGSLSGGVLLKPLKPDPVLEKNCSFK